jgi:Tfp pilus assembly protein PilV
MKFKRLSLPITSAGDTIIEVLICIALAGAVIMGAYALASNSLQEGISASEHGEAAKLVESQVERLKFRQANTKIDDWTNLFANNSSGHANYCLGDTVKPQDAANWNPQINPQPNNLVVGASGYTAACVWPQSDPKYYINIAVGATTNPGDNPTYLITVKWEPIDGGPNSQAQVYYRF